MIAPPSPLRSSRRHQDHALIRARARPPPRPSALFLYRDARAAEVAYLVHMLYRQQYCGCVFSEYDRYRHTRTHLWPPQKSVKIRNRVAKTRGDWYCPRYFVSKKGKGTKKIICRR